MRPVAGPPLRKGGRRAIGAIATRSGSDQAPVEGLPTAKSPSTFNRKPQSDKLLGYRGTTPGFVSILGFDYQTRSSVSVLTQQLLAGPEFDSSLRRRTIHVRGASTDEEEVGFS